MSFHSGSVRIRRAPPSTKPPRPTHSTSTSDSDQPDGYTPYPTRRQSASRLIVRTNSHRRTARRYNSTPRPSNQRHPTQSLASCLQTHAKLHLLVRAVYLPRHCRSWRIVVHTAACRNSQWRSVGTLTTAPSVLEVACTLEQLPTRLLRVCVYQQLKNGGAGKELGLCIVRTATVLAESSALGDECYEAQLQCHAVGGRDCGVVQLAAAPASQKSARVSVLVTAGISMQKEVRGCRMQLWRVADRTALLVGESVGGSHGFERVDVAAALLWFGVRREKMLTLRVQFVKRGWRKWFVMGCLELSVAQIARLREGELLKMRWITTAGGVQGVRCVVVDRVVLGEHGACLELRLSR